jgi:hypothetical protein
MLHVSAPQSHHQASTEEQIHIRMGSQLYKIKIWICSSVEASVEPKNVALYISVF